MKIVDTARTVSLIGAVHPTLSTASVPPAPPALSCEVSTPPTLSTASTPPAPPALSGEVSAACAPLASLAVSALAAPSVPVRLNGALCVGRLDWRALVLAFGFALAACGGSGDAAPATPTALTAPSLSDLGARTVGINMVATPIVFTNTGGAVQAGGCMATGLPNGLAAVVSGNSCAITGMPTVATEGAVTVTVTAVNSVGTVTATVMLTVSTSPVAPMPLTVPSLVSAGTRAFSANLRIDEVVFVNVGTAPQTCTGTGLPVGLEVSLSDDSTSCKITGTATTDSNGPVTATVTAANANGMSEATLFLIVKGGSPSLVVPTERPVLTIDVEIVNAIDLSVPNGGLTFESCRFLSGDQDFPTLDGLTVTSIARPGSSFDTTCRITGTLIPATNANDIERTYIIRSRSAAPPFPFSYTPLTVNVVVPESSTSPKLPDEAVNAITADGVALPNAVIVRNLFAGADITECFFIDGSNAQQATLDGLSIAKATDGRACLITGTLRGTGTKTFNVRALSAAGQDDGSVVFSFSNDLTPVLSANLPSASPILGGQIEPIIISNTNPAITLKEGDCKLVDGAGNILLSRRAPSGRGRWRLDGLVMSDGPPESNTCVIEGAPSLHDRYDVRVRADNGVHMSNVIFWEFNVLLNPALDFAPDEVSRNVGGAPFTITPNAANTFDFSAATSTWSSSNNAVATVSANGEVTILTIGETVISVSTAAAPRIGTGMASYTLTVMAHPPNLPDSIATVVAVAGQTLAPTLSLANATDGADIVMCFLLDGATPMATLGGLSIAKAADNRSCIISGALTNAGDQTITVRATSASAQDEATVNFAVIPSTQAALRTPTTEFEVELNMQIDTVILNNFNTATATALAAGNCVLVDDMGDVISSALANNQYTVDGLTVATDVSAGTCTVTGTPTTAGRRTLNVRADNDNGVGNIIELTFIVRDIDTPGLEEEAVSKRFGDAAFTNAFTATTRSTDSFTWTSSTPSVATVGGDGEVTILTAGNTTITATRAQSDSIEAATLSYSLMVATFPPDLPEGPITADAVDELPISNFVTLANDEDGADITSCAFIASSTPVASLSGLTISADSDRRGCTITGTLTGTGEQTFTVRALSASDQDEVTVVFTVTPKPLRAVSQVDSGLNKTCAISTGGELYCWGSRVVEGNINRPDRPNTDTTWIQVSASATYSCGINRISFGNSFGNSILCWGSNARNLLGAGFATDDNNPRRIDSSAGVAWQQLSAGSMHTCAVDAGEDARPGGRLHCWGIGAGHRLGMGTDVTNRFGPSFRNSRVGSDTTWIQVSAGGAHSCATNVAGELHCWGSNSSGQTGQGGTPSSSPTMMPAQVGMATNWAQVSAGEAHTCALNTDDELYCWGESDNGRLGLGTVSADGASPVEVAAPTGTSWAQASTGSEHTCAITMANTLYCWGEGDNGRLGLGAEDTADKTTPTQIGSDTDWVMVSAGGAHTCAIKTVDQLYCWGKADSGQLGLGDTDGTNTQSNTPARVTPAPMTGALPQGVSR